MRRLRGVACRRHFAEVRALRGPHLRGESAALLPQLPPALRARFDELQRLLVELPLGNLGLSTTPQSFPPRQLRILREGNGLAYEQ